MLKRSSSPTSHLKLLAASTRSRLPFYILQAPQNLRAVCLGSLRNKLTSLANLIPNFRASVKSERKQIFPNYKHTPLPPKKDPLTLLLKQIPSYVCVQYIMYSKKRLPGLRPRPHRNTGAMTSVIVASILIRTWIEGPAVSLNGSPTVSPVIAAL